MSQKPLKHDEIIRRAKKAERKQGTRLKSPYRYLIFCEGTKTEPAYFSRIKQIIDKKFSDRFTVVLEVQGVGESCHKLMEHAENYIKRTKLKYDFVWLIFDKDDFPLADFDNTVYSTDQKTANACGQMPQWFCGWSNQCIELWFILHFEYYHVPHQRADYITKLNDIFGRHGLGQYTKNNPQIFDILTDHGDLMFAIKNASKLQKLNSGKSPALSDPATTVYLLINELLPYF